MRRGTFSKLISLGVIFALILTTGGINFFPSSSWAETFVFIEDFSTTNYKDNANTTADWNTTFSKLRLPRLGWTKADEVTPGYDNISNSSGQSWFPQIILDSNGKPNIVWYDETVGNYEIYFSKWNGLAWSGLATSNYDNISSNLGNSRDPKIVLDSSGRPNIVWWDGTEGNFDIFFSHWDGATWTGLATSNSYDNVSQNAGQSEYPEIVLDTGGRPNIVWEDDTTGNYDIFFSRWDGATWTGLATAGYDNLSNNNGWSSDPQITLDSSDSPHVIWNDTDPGNSDVFFTKWNGAQWTHADGSTPGCDNLSNDSGNSENPRIVINSSQQPNIVWQDSTTANYEILFSKWNGSAWTEIMTTTANYDNLSNNSGGSLSPQIILDSSQRPHVTWEDMTTGNYDILFTKWSGAQWTCADGSTPGYDDLSNNNGNSVSPRIALDANQRPKIVWFDLSPGNPDVLFSQFNGSIWTKADDETPGYDNISNNSGASECPQIALEANGRPNIVWYDDATTTNTDIFFSKYIKDFQSPKQAQSIKINTTTKNIFKARLNPNQSLNGQNITYYLSGNGGTNWELVTPNAEHLFAYQGNDLRWKAVLETSNPSLTPEIDSLTIDYTLVDTTPPTGSILINSGALYTTSNSVILTLTATDTETGVTGVCFSNDNTLWSGWESFSSTELWSLSSPEGVKTVYVKYKDGANPTNESTYSDNIVLDLSKPQGSILINNGAQYTNSASVTLTLTGTDGNGSGVEKMIISNDSLFSNSSWETYNIAKSWALTSGNGTKSVYVKYKDRVGYESNTYSDNIILDTTKPVGSILINNGSDITHSALVTLTIIAQDIVGVTQMIISNRNNFSDTSWETYQTQKSWTLLTPKGGESTVYVRFKDSAGNESAIYSDSINVITQKFSRRLYGETRYETAVAISKEGWVTSDKIVLARGDLFPDALAGAPLANKYNAPILLTNPGFLTQSTSEEIVRLKAKEIFILGASKAVSEDVVADLKEKCGISTDKIHRYGGETRYETAQLISKQLTPPANKTAIIATGENYPDALASASVAAYKGIPILLVRGDLSLIPSATKQALKDLSITTLALMGGEDVVPKAIDDEFKKEGYKTSRYAGETRYETCRSIASWSFSLGMKPDVVALAVGENFPDALSIGPLAAKNRAPLIMVREFVPESIKEWFSAQKGKIYTLYIAGGPGAVSETIVDEVKSLAGF